ncbi:acetoacetate metabolism regulatory protein AtoC [Candidatus Methylomirabilis lanthanidiphila]|uniref:Acetoacetate metabolism regulatory protein AtoC n=1 Tax=Candidatus Methylomirabilis lanthanidiphila TaxID=2211376 RepID=A0A564ZER2_9BACT|nr:sigma-54 dependent transcriptional regulator [Candidatus Methylomirabilis lanthanidiphila]VUZ83653.1 acetoacetate metabolism regulatory protein AtoC [Candidatus Methylomirabilis lanthanidiphila]
METILVVDDEQGLREFLTALLEHAGYLVRTASDGEQALEHVAHQVPDLVISDIRMPKMDGIGLLTGIRKTYPHVPVIMMTAYASMDSTIQAMRLGADDYITKPFRIDEIRLVVEKALAKARTRSLGQTAQPVAMEEVQAAGLIGRSPKMVELYKLITRVAELDSTVLITGESGTGKELVARTLHCASPRAARPFLAINCGAIPEQLLESELFGHVKGSFTGAVSHKTGLFEVANLGTVLLDEIAEMSPVLQVKLLRFLQGRTFRRVGGTEDLEVDIRLIAATNKDLVKAMADGTFREDLFYRLNVIPIHLPPLRERTEDVPLLANRLLAQCTLRQQRDPTSISPEAMEILVRYHWPGNVRELENVIERALALETSDQLTPASICVQVRTEGEGEGPQRLSTFALPSEGIDLEQTVSELEKELMLQALERSGWVQSKAAELLNLTFRAFRYKVKKYGISKAH